MNKIYNPIVWVNNLPPALNEDNLNAMSQALSDLDDRVISLAGTIMEDVPAIQDALEEVEAFTANPPYIGASGNWYVWDTETGAYIDSGIDASITISIADVTMLNYGSTPYVTNTGTDTDPIFHLFIPKAAGVSSVTKTGTSGLVDTYTITFEDGTTGTFTVTNGASQDISGKMDVNGNNASNNLAFGANASASNDTYAFAAGKATATGTYAFAMGNGVNATTGTKFVVGKNNVDESGALFEVGDGTMPSSRRNAFTVYQNGDINVRGGIYINQEKLNYNMLVTSLSQSITLSTSSDVTATFSDNAIKANSKVDVYTTDPNLTYKTMNISAGTVTVTFAKQDSASTITVQIDIK